MLSERYVPVNPLATAGFHVIGYFLNWGLFGALCVQVFLYYWAFPKDKLFLKLVVYGLFALDIIQTALITKDAFFKFGTHFGNVTIFASLENLWFSVFVINATSGAIVQLFFAYRISVLSKSRIVATLVALLAVAGCAAGITSGVRAKISRVDNLSAIAFGTKTEFSVWLSISAACDIVITACIVTILSRNRGNGLKKTDDTIRKIIWVTVETGTLTTLVAILTMALTIAFPEKALCTILMDIIGKIYSNNFLVILNRRMMIVDGRSIVTQSETQQDSFCFSSPNTNRSATSETITEVKIEQQVWPKNNDSKEEDM
ncbi:hypothetical protein E1B28_003617 [Marasmius oreades]|uniref:DUF6534 domain-containing protein n=1 Tax=Marasmius oreades TaxID=181124 RepID=A0A9P7UKV8_9AGAR|nr:uncharacterized protein E1B28_003617 [Marasmius oreades]KAG7086103.1 hypothetical protein E1B28_003617 [Marasmius oreades]